MDEQPAESGSEQASRAEGETEYPKAGFESSPDEKEDEGVGSVPQDEGEKF